MRIGERLKVAVAALGLKTPEFAALVGIPKRTIEDYLACKRDPGGENLAKICTQSRVSAAWLLTGEGDVLRGADATEKDGATRQDIPAALAGQQRRVDALLRLLADLDQESREAVLVDCFARATTAQQLADLRAAVSELAARKTA